MNNFGDRIEWSYGEIGCESGENEQYNADQGF